MKKKYAQICWEVDDILTLNPTWSQEKAIKFLKEHESRIMDAMTGAGWEVIEDQLRIEDNYGIKAFPEKRQNTDKNTEKVPENNVFSTTENDDEVDSILDLTYEVCNKCKCIVKNGRCCC